MTDPDTIRRLHDEWCARKCGGHCLMPGLLRRAHSLGVKAGLERAAGWLEFESGMGDATTIRRHVGKVARIMAREIRTLAPAPDLSTCPECGGPADNGHDREVPPNPYLCTRCIGGGPDNWPGREPDNEHG